MIQSEEVKGHRNFNSLQQDGNQPDMLSPRSRVYIGEPDARLSAGVLFALIGFCLACVQSPALVAQTVQFTGETRPLGSGFSSPYGVAVDGSGNVFVADSFNGAVKEMVAVGGSIPVTPTIRTLGSGFSDPTGVAVDGSGNVYVADVVNKAVYEMLAVGGSVPASPTIRALGSGFKQPWGVAIDGSGNIYVADRDEAIYEMLAVNGSIPTNPTINTLGSGFSEPTGVAVDGSGNVYVAEPDTSVVIEMLAVNGSIPTNPTIRTLGSGFTNPFGVAVDGSGNVFVADTYNNVVKEMVAVGGSIPAAPTINTLGRGFEYPAGVAVDANGNVFVVDSGKAVKEIPKIDGFGPVTVGASSFVISNYFTFGTAGTLYGYGVVTQGALSLDFTDAGTGTCQRGAAYNTGDYCSVDVIFKPTAPGLRSGAVQLVSGSALLATAYVQGTGVGPRVNFLPAQQSTPISGLGTPYGMAADVLGDVYFADAAKNTVTDVVATNGVIRTNPSSINLGSGFSGPRDVAVDGAGNVFVADYGNGEVKEMLALNEYASPQAVGSGFVSPSAVAVDGSGNVFVADAGNGTVKEILKSSNYATTVTLASGFTQPAGVAVDANGNVYVTDYTAGTVNEILAVDGAIPANPSVVSLGSGFSGPWGIAVDANGNVLVADYGHDAVKELVAVNGVIPSSPTINTLGSGWNGPSGVVVDEHGVVYVSNASTGTIAELDYADPPSLQFASTQAGSISSDSPKSITLVNQGTSPLNAVPPGLSAPADFKLAAGTGTPADCTATFSLVPGASCDLSIDFAPVTIGNPLSESLVLTDNSLNAGPPGYPSQSISLSGIGTQGPAALKSPAPGGTLPGPTVTFGWTTGAGVTSYALWLGTTGAGSYNLYYSSALSVTSVSVAHLPTNGETIYARLISIIGGVQSHLDYTYTAATQSALTTPAPSTMLTGPDVSFAWTGAAGATNYQFWLGTTGVGSYNVYYSGALIGTSVGVVHIPTNGVTVYARLITNYGGVQVPADYTYTATSTALETPAPFGTLAGPNVTFTWLPAIGATGYQLWLGSTGAGSYNLYYEATQVGNSVAIAHIPTNGSTVYARLITHFNSVLIIQDYTYSAATQAVLTTPAPSGTLPGPNATFSWTAGTGASSYQLWLGSTGVGSDNVYYSGPQTATSLAVAHIPTNGETIYARLITTYNGVQEHYAYTYTAATQSALTTPTPGTKLQGSSVTFDWTAAPGATSYQLWLGSTGAGSYNLYYSGALAATSATVNNLPTNGATVYARLITNYSGVQVSTDYTYTAQ